MAPCLGGEGEDGGDDTPRYPPLGSVVVGSNAGEIALLPVCGRRTGIFTGKDTKHGNNAKIIDIISLD